MAIQTREGMPGGEARAPTATIGCELQAEHPPRWTSSEWRRRLGNRRIHNRRNARASMHPE